MPRDCKNPYPSLAYLPFQPLQFVLLPEAPSAVLLSVSEIASTAGAQAVGLRWVQDLLQPCIRNAARLGVLAGPTTSANA